MTLEEKIKERMTSEAVAQSKEFDCDFFVARHSFTKGAVWMLSELKPVMEEMKEALETVSVWHMNLSHTTDINHRAKRVLSKYNELFKK